MKSTSGIGRVVLVLLAGLLVLSGITVSAKSYKGGPITEAKGKFKSAPQQAVQGIQPQAVVPSADAGTAAQFPRDMRMLVVAATAQEPSYAAVTTFLDRVGIPYTAMIASEQTLTSDFLMKPDGSQGNFQGVILTTGNLGYEVSPDVWQSAFTDAEWNTLWTYEAKYNVRQVTFYTYPGSLPDNYGLIDAGTVDTGENPLRVHLTAEGKTYFPYLNPNGSFEVRDAWTYLTLPEQGVVPLLQTADGYTLAAVKTYPDGRQNLALTMDHNPNLMHSMLLHYGVLNWVTKGVFIGERHVYLNMQVDDILIPDDIWDPKALADSTGLEYRMTGDDLWASTDWKDAFQSANPLFGSWTYAFAFNGSGAAKGDDLTKAVIANRGEYEWINHTWDHENLNATTYDTTLKQLQRNNKYAHDAGLKAFTNKVLVTPDVSGLNNADAMHAAYAAGVRYVVCDMSYATCQPSIPNTGIWNPLQTGLFEIPRHATNIFYNVTTPEELVSEYNYLYRWYWGRDLSYEDILDVESDNYLRYMLQFSMNPLMFHQSNIRAYDGTHSLLSDVVDRTAAKYNAIMGLPVIKQTMQATAQEMQARMKWMSSNAVGVHYPGSKIVLTVTSPTDVKVPVTGVAAGEKENYGGQTISTVKVPHDHPLVISPAP